MTMLNAKLSHFLNVHTKTLSKIKLYNCKNKKLVKNSITISNRHSALDAESMLFKKISYCILMDSFFPGCCRIVIIGLKPMFFELLSISILLSGDS